MTTATGLLVSVRSAAEALVALQAGVDLLDVKEPSRGPLGRADWQVIADVARCAAGRVPVSAALGELLELPDATGLPQGRLPQGLAFAKLGLSGCTDWADWPGRWEAAVAQLPPGVASVAVAYADWRSCGAPPPGEVLQVGSQLGCGAALLDTCDKGAASLFDQCTDREVAEWIDEGRRSGMRVVIAGSLTFQTAARAAALGPDYIAVRGAACRGGRSGELDAGRIAGLRSRLAHSSVVRSQSSHERATIR